MDILTQDAENRANSHSQAADSVASARLENLRMVAEVLGADRGWFGWGPLLSSKDRLPKVPTWINSKGEGKSDAYEDIANSVSFATALGWIGTSPKGCRGRKFLGVGFEILAAKDGRTVVLDYDNVLTDGEATTETGREVLEHFAAAYVEISPSRKGLRVICLSGPDGIGWSGKTGKVDLPGGGSVEIYEAAKDSPKFFRLSGDRVAEVARVGVEWEQIDALAWAVEKAEAAKASKDKRAVPARGVIPTDPASSASASPASSSSVSSSPPAPAAPDLIALPIEPRAGESWGDLAAMFLDKLIALEPITFKGWHKTARDPENVLKSFQTVTGKNGKQADGKLGKVMRGEWKDSEADQFRCCEAIRAGARDLEHVRWVWEGTPAWRPEKVRGREDNYVNRTIAMAARAVLVDALERTDPRRDVVNAIKAAAAAAGESLKLTAEGTRLTASLGNVVALLRLEEAYRGCARFNEFTQTAERARSWRMFDPGACDVPGKLRDDDVSRLRLGIERKFGINIEGKLGNEAIEVVARDNAYHPVRDRLHELHARWVGDGRQPRLRRWLIEHAKACEEWDGHDLSAYLAEVGALMLVTVVARAFQPGCKADSQLTLVGAEGGRKSSLWKAMADAIGPGLFTDSVPALDGDPAKLWEATQGFLIVEIAEGAAVRKSELQGAKAALSSTGGQFRQAWGQRAEERPRAFALVSTANDMEFLPNSDAALRRRFWPVPVSASKVSPIDIDGLSEVAGLLWGEAVDLYLEMSDGGTRGPGLFIDPSSQPAAYRGWMVLLDLVSDEAGPYADILFELNQHWHGYAVEPPYGKTWPEVGCTPREIAELVGYRQGEGKFDNADARKVCDWCRAVGMLTYRRQGSTRIRASVGRPLGPYDC